MGSIDNNGLVLDIGIVGAGIAGLTAAAVLSRQGHNVELYERSQFKNEVGAAINVGPNSAPVLQAVDFSIANARFLEVEQGAQFDGATMQERYRGRYENYDKKFGAFWYFSHRVDLHKELQRVALENPDGTRAARLNLSAQVTGVDCEKGTLSFEDGASVRKDVIIGADGVHSIVAQAVLGSSMPKVEIGQCAYRFLLPTSDLLSNPITAPLFKEYRTTMSVASGPDRRIVWYPCRSGELMNFGCIHPAKDDRDEMEDWNVSGSKQDLLDTYSDFHPALREVCRLAKDPKLWKLVYRPPIKHWAKGKAILIGDAAHPMLPHQAQGASQGIEDAGALGVFLSGIKDLSEVPDRLEQVQDARRCRAAALQIFSNAGQDEASQIEAEAKKYIKGDVPKSQEEFHQWNFGYNVIEDCKAKLAKWQSTVPRQDGSVFL